MSLWLSRRALLSASMLRWRSRGGMPRVPEPAALAQRVVPAEVSTHGLQEARYEMQQAKQQLDEKLVGVQSAVAESLVIS